VEMHRFRFHAHDEAPSDRLLTLRKKLGSFSSRVRIQEYGSMPIGAISGTLNLW
jgi:hypothetical protein